MKSVDHMMRQGVCDNVFPGGVLSVWSSGNQVFEEAYGVTDHTVSAPVRTDTLFDLASLTKPLATALAAMILIEQKRLDLNWKIGEVIADLRHTEKQDIEIRHLLIHNSGLTDYRPYYLTLQNLPFSQRKTALHQMLVDEPLISGIGEKTRYSDIGFMLLQWVIETITQTGLDIFIQSSAYAPLNIKDLFFVPGNRPLSTDNVAATEQCPWRRTLVKGGVHDENAHILGGVAGHAGLFGTADAICRLLETLLNAYHGDAPDNIFSPAVVRTFLSSQSDSDRALGFDRPSAKHSSCGDGFNKAATFGHLGYTGTSFWMDTAQSIIVVLLTNRVHPSRRNEKIRQFRPRLHNAVIRAILKDR